MQVACPGCSTDTFRETLNPQTKLGSGKGRCPKWLGASCRGDSGRWMGSASSKKKVWSKDPTRLSNPSTYIHVFTSCVKQADKCFAGGTSHRFSSSFDLDSNCHLPLSRQKPWTSPSTSKKRTSAPSSRPAFPSQSPPPPAFPSTRSGQEYQLSRSNVRAPKPVLLNLKMPQQHPHGRSRQSRRKLLDQLA